MEKRPEQEDEQTENNGKASTSHLDRLERLANADAFGSLGLTRREALWAVRALQRAYDRDKSESSVEPALPK